MGGRVIELARNFCTGILVGIFTMSLADGRMDRTDNGHMLTDRVPGGIMSRSADRQVMQLTYGWTCQYDSMTDR